MYYLPLSLTLSLSLCRAQKRVLSSSLNMCVLKEGTKISYEVTTSLFLAGKKFAFF